MKSATMVLAEGGKIEQEYVDAAARRYLSILEDAGLGADHEAIQVAMELEGGPCRWCGKPWVLHEVRSELFGHFTYYRPTCSCLARRIESSKGGTSIDAERGFAFADFPVRYAEAELEKMDRNVAPSIVAALDTVGGWVDSEDWRKGVGLLLLGAVGTGKTMAAVGALKAIIRRGARGKFIQTASLVDRIIRAKEERGYIEWVLNNDVVILDDFDKIATENDWTRSQVFGFIDSAYAKKVSIIITTSEKSVPELGSRFSYDLMSRILGVSRVVNFEGSPRDDYRRRKV